MTLTLQGTKFAAEGLTITALLYERDQRWEEAKLCRALAHALREGQTVEGQAW